MLSAPYASYKVRLWIEDSEVRKRVGALVCHTKEGGENTVNYYTCVLCLRLVLRVTHRKFNVNGSCSLPTLLSLYKVWMVWLITLVIWITFKALQQRSIHLFVCVLVSAYRSSELDDNCTKLDLSFGAMVSTSSDKWYTQRLQYYGKNWCLFPTVPKYF